MQYLYLLRQGQRYYKVGISHNVRSRVVTLQMHIPHKVEIVCTKFLDTQAYDAEQKIHESLKQYRTDGANEWFELSPEQAIDLCIRINSYPDIDISERVTLATIANNVKRNQRLIERKLDYVINTYQRFKPKDVVKQEVRAEVIVPVSVEKIIREVEKRPTKEDLDNALFEQAREVIETIGYASTSMLQRRLSIGYGRAARIMDKLEEDGIIGPADGSRARQVITG